MRRGAGPKRKAMKRKPPPPGFTEETKKTVRRRSAGRCEAGTSKCTGGGAHFHHRKLRRSGDHRAVNCLLVCPACHEHIHANPTMSYLMGFLVHEWQDPADVLVKVGARR